ncbi:MAG: HIT family protein [Kiritimatiellae bacterium]|nr:HIT family protein [Kiritimatiellia bacterium]
MKNNCVFCAIAAGEIPCFKVYEDDIVLAYLDINPFAEGHTLVIPKDHSTGLLDTSPDTLREMIARVQKVSARIKDALPCDGFNILQNNGPAAGQTVPHLHFHIVPRLGSDVSADISFANHPGDMDRLKSLAERLRF